MNELDLSTPQRQEAVGIIVYFFNNLRKSANVLIGVVAGLALKPEWIIYLGFAIAAGLIVAGIFAYLQYRRFTFHIVASELIINEGVFVRDRTTIPFDRIQTVHLHQNFIQRILQLTGVKIDTAGSSNKELEIRALKKPFALQLQEVLQKQTAQDILAKEQEKAAQPDGPTLGTASREVLVKLSMWELLKVAITENHIRNGLLAAAVIFGYISQYERFFENYLNPFLEQYIPHVQKSGFYAILFMIIFFLIVSIVISFAKVFLKFFDLEASLSQSAFQVKAGLLKRNEYTIPLRKIQFMEWNTNFLRKIPGFESVKIYQGQSQESSGKQTIEIPACFKPQTKRIETILFPEKESEHTYASFRSHRSYILFLLTIFGTIGLAVTSVLHYNTQAYWPWVAFGGYMVVAAVLIWQFVRSIRLKTNGDLIIYERGWLFPKRTLIKSYKIQSLKWRQTVFQRRRDLGHISIYTAAGKRTVRFLPIQMVREFHNYMIYRVETHQGSWM